MALAFSLALIAGYTDALAYLAVHMWAANMTGSLVFFGIALTERAYLGAAQHIGTVLVFALGIIAARWSRHLLRRPGEALALPAALAAVATPLFPKLPGFYLLAFAMGAQNGSVTRFGGVTVNTAFITGNLEKLGEGVGDPDPRSPPGFIGGVIAAYGAGGILGAVAHWLVPLPLPLIATAAGLAIVAVLTVRLDPDASR
jgi:uncharacterized membrane protein YoaK (UPF0700 family)